MMVSAQQLMSIAGLLLLSSGLNAQGSADPSGHWEGTIKTPQREISIEVDVARNATGALAGTFGNIGDKLRGYPLSGVAIDGRKVHFVLNAGMEGGTFDGRLSDDGKGIDGTFATTTSEGSFNLPFSLMRTGDAKIDVAAKNAAIEKTFEGTWTGTMMAGAQELRLVLKLANGVDGSSGTIMAGPAGGPDGAELPAATIVQKDKTITVTFKIANGAYAATLNEARTQLEGTWTQGTFSAPLTLARAEKK